MEVSFPQRFILSKVGVVSDFYSACRGTPWEVAPSGGAGAGCRRSQAASAGGPARRGAGLSRRFSMDGFSFSLCSDSPCPG